MTVLAQGNELSDFVLNNAQSSFITHDTQAGSYTTANARGAMRLQSGGAASFTGFTDQRSIRAEGFSVSSGDLWVHFKIHISGVGATAQTAGVMLYLANAGTELLRIANSSSNSFDSTFNIFKNVSSNIGSFSNAGFSAGTLYTYDICCRLGNPGAIFIYRNAVLLASVTGLNLDWESSVDSIHFPIWQRGSSSFDIEYHRLSEIIIAHNTPTIGAKVVTRPPTGAGEYSDWTSGVYTDVDELVPDANIMTSDTADQRASFTHDAFTALTGAEYIGAAQVSAWALRNTVGPQNLNLFSRIGTTDYDGSDQEPSLLYNSHRHFLLNNPAGGAWDISDLNAAEFGIRSRT